jgi:hypothetical protein
MRRSCLLPWEVAFTTPSNQHLVTRLPNQLACRTTQHLQLQSTYPAQTAQCTSSLVALPAGRQTAGTWNGPTSCYLTVSDWPGPTVLDCVTLKQQRPCSGSHLAAVVHGSVALATTILTVSCLFTSAHCYDTQFLEEKEANSINKFKLRKHHPLAQPGPTLTRSRFSQASLRLPAVIIDA